MDEYERTIAMYEAEASTTLHTPPDPSALSGADETVADCDPPSLEGPTTSGPPNVEVPVVGVGDERWVTVEEEGGTVHVGVSSIEMAAETEVPPAVNERRADLPLTGATSSFSFTPLELCGESAYSFVLFQNFWAVLLWLAIVGGQVSLFGYVAYRQVVYGERTFLNELNDTGITVALYLMYIALAPDIIMGVRLMTHRDKKKVGVFWAGFAHVIVAVTAAYAGWVYGLQKADTNTDFIIETSGILFITQLDEQLSGLLRYFSPKWYEIQINRLSTDDEPTTEKNRKCSAFSFPTPSKTDETVLDLCEDSAYSFLLIGNVWAVLAWAVVFGAQVFILSYLAFLTESQDRPDGDLGTYQDIWQEEKSCTGRSTPTIWNLIFKKSNVRSDSSEGIYAGGLIVSLAVMPHFFKGVQIILKSKQSKKFHKDIFAVGMSYCFVSAWSVVCAFLFTAKIAQNSGDFVVQSVAVLIVELMDEQLSSVFAHCCPTWYRSKMKALRMRVEIGTQRANSATTEALVPSEDQVAPDIAEEPQKRPHNPLFDMPYFSRDADMNLVEFVEQSAYGLVLFKSVVPYALWTILFLGQIWALVYLAFNNDRVGVSDCGCQQCNKSILAQNVLVDFSNSLVLSEENFTDYRNSNPYFRACDLSFATGSAITFLKSSPYYFNESTACQTICPNITGFEEAPGCYDACNQDVCDRTEDTTQVDGVAIFAGFILLILGSIPYMILGIQLLVSRERFRACGLRWNVVASGAALLILGIFTILLGGLLARDRSGTGSDFILEAATVLFIVDLEANFPRMIKVAIPKWWAGQIETLVSASTNSETAMREHSES